MGSLFPLRHSILLIKLSNLSLHMWSFPSRVPRLAVRVLSEEVALLENTEHSCIGLWLLESMLIKFLVVTAKCHLKYAGFFVVVWACWRILSVFVSCESAVVKLVWRKLVGKRVVAFFFSVLLTSEWFLNYFMKRYYWKFHWQQSLVIKLEVRACKVKKQKQVVPPGSPFLSNLGRKRL